MGLSIAAIVGGLVLLVWGADRFVTGAAGLASRLGISTLVIGLTVVGFATSAPEMLVSASAAWAGNPGLAVGNALGSNVANIGLVLGITALLVPLGMSSGTLRRELPILLVITAAAALLLVDGELGRIDGIIMLVTLGGVLFWIVKVARSSGRDDPIAAEFAEEIPTGGTTASYVAALILGLLVLLGGAQVLVWGAVNVAQAMGVSDLVIGLTIVAIGTSLPELAASIAGVRKGEPDIAVGNIIGSNLFNLLAVMGIAGVIDPAPLASEVLVRDYPVMAGMTALLALLVYNSIGTRGKISRFEGFLLVTVYAAYMAWIYFSSVA